MGKAFSPLTIAAWSSALLALVKLAAFLGTGSLVILGSFFDSLVDSIVSFANHRVQLLALKRPDREHPFGHGGFEVVSSLVQGFVISIAGIILILQSAERLITPDAKSLLQSDHLLFGVGALVFSAAGGAAIQSFLGHFERKLAKNNQRSLSLSSDRAHYLADFWYNISAAAGVLLVWYTEIAILDAIFGLLGAILLLRAAFPILRQCVRDILHTEVEPTLQQAIVDTVLAVDSRIKGLHRLRSRQLGPTQFIDFHLKLPSNLSLHTAHDLGDKVTRTLRKKFPGLDVIIHLDPEDEPDDDLWDPAYNT